MGPVCDEDIGGSGSAIITVRGEHDLLSIIREHGEGIEGVIEGDLF